MGAILTLAWKDVRLCLRDKFALFWLFAFPLMYALFFGSIFGGGDDDGARSQLPIAVVDEDGSDASRALLQRLADHDALRVERESVEAEEGEDADADDGAMDGAPVPANLEDARDDVRKGKKVAYVRILAGYGDSPFKMFGGGDGGTALEVGIDPSRAAEAGILRGILMQTVFGGLSESMADKDAILEQIDLGKQEIAEADDIGAGQKLILQTFMGALGTFLSEVDLDVLEEGTSGMADQELVEVIEVTRERGNEPRSAFDITFPTAMIWGLMTVALTFAITLVRERTQGTLLRLRIAPLSRAQILAGKALGCFAMCQVVMIFLMGFGVVALGVNVSSYPLAFLSMFCTALCFTGLMMVAAVMGKTEQAVAGASWGAMMPFAMIGGGMIPLIAMPPWLLALSDYSPFKWGIYSMEGAVWRGFGLGEMLFPCAVLIGLGAIFFTLGVWVFRRMER